jgi:hypothetical protein
VTLPGIFLSAGANRQSPTPWPALFSTDGGITWANSPKGVTYERQTTVIDGEFIMLIDATVAYKSKDGVNWSVFAGAFSGLLAASPGYQLHLDLRFVIICSCGNCFDTPQFDGLLFYIEVTISYYFLRRCRPLCLDGEERWSNIESDIRLWSQEDWAVCLRLVDWTIQPCRLRFS